MEVAVREAKTKFLKSQIGLPTFDVLYAPVQLEYPTDLALRLVALSHYVKLKVSTLTILKATYTENNFGKRY